MSVDVIYFVESVPKELDVACIVSRMLEKSFGLRVQIASYKADAPAWLLRTKPKLVVIPTCYAAESWGLKKHVAQWPGVPFLNLSWEELWSKANSTWKHPRDSFAKKHVLHHVWGDFYKAFLTSHGVPSEHVLVNGHPGYRLYESTYREYFPSRSELARRYELNPEKHLILFSENYGWAFYGEANMGARVKGGMDPTIPPMLREFCRDSLRIVLDWCRQCAEDDGVEMIIRPRPSTSLSQFRTASRELMGGPLGKVRLIKEGMINEWILASDVVVSSFSTSLIEAALAGKPAYMVAPVPLPDALWSFWYGEVECLTTREEFLSMCLNQRDAAAGNQRLRDWAIQTFLSRGDPITNLVATIGHICEGRLRTPAPPSPDMLPARSERGLLEGVLRDAWTRLQGLAPRRGDIGDQDFRVFGPRDVLYRRRGWERLLSDSAAKA
jgi:hypothetical protein